MADSGYTDQQIADALGWSHQTVRKWPRRFRRGGSAALVSRPRRPPTGTFSCFSESVRQAVMRLRTYHPGRGPKTLRLELSRIDSYQSLPSRSGLAKWLAEQGLSRRHAHRSALPEATVGAALHPHHVWQLDIRGHEYVPDIGVIGLINILDVWSRVKIVSYPCWPGPHLPTRLHLWLVALGIEVRFARVHRPTDHACVERSHQTWDAQVLKGQQFSTWFALQTALTRRRPVLNALLPCASLNETPPLVAHPEACFARRLYRPEWETDLFDLSALHAYLARGRWFRTVSAVGTFSFGGYVYALNQTWAKKEVEIHFDPLEAALTVHLPASTDTKRLPIKGLDPAHLIGESGTLLHLDHFQLALPFTWADWKTLHLSQLLPSAQGYDLIGFVALGYFSVFIDTVSKQEISYGYY